MHTATEMAGFLFVANAACPIHNLPLWAKSPAIARSASLSQEYVGYRSGGTFAMTLKKSERSTNEFCLCGCGERIGTQTKHGFRPGHHKRTPEARALQAERMASNVLSPEARERIRVANTGRVPTAEARANMAAAQRGRKHSDESKAKRSVALRGRVFSAETRAKMSAFQRTRRLSEEHKQKIGKASKGHPAYPNQQKAATESNKRRWQLLPRSPTSKWPYPRGWASARLAARRRDGNKCMVDPAHPLRSRVNRAFDVHHIDSNKNNVNLENLICLCRSCHLKAEKDPTESIPRLRAILVGCYGYTYD